MTPSTKITSAIGYETPLYYDWIMRMILMIMRIVMIIEVAMVVVV